MGIKRIIDSLYSLLYKSYVVKRMDTYLDPSQFRDTFIVRIRGKQIGTNK